MSWNDSFCRDIGPENNFGCYVEVENATKQEKSECQLSKCYFYRWEGKFQSRYGLKIMTYSRRKS